MLKYRFFFKVLAWQILMLSEHLMKHLCSACRNDPEILGAYQFNPPSCSNLSVCGLLQCLFQLDGKQVQGRVSQLPSSTRQPAGLNVIFSSSDNVFLLSVCMKTGPRWMPSPFLCIVTQYSLILTIQTFVTYLFGKAANILKNHSPPLRHSHFSPLSSPVRYKIQKLKHVLRFKNSFPPLLPDYSPLLPDCHPLISCIPDLPIHLMTALTLFLIYTFSSCITNSEFCFL